MTSSPHGSHHHSEPAKMEQIITEFFAKSLHIILDSRSRCVSSRNYSGEQTMSPCSSSSSSSSVRPRDKWFNLALRECPAAMENLDFWRHSNLEPMFVDVVLVQRQVDLDPSKPSPGRNFVRSVSFNERFPNYLNFGQDEFLSESKSQKIIERWIVQYESRKSGEYSSGSKRTSCTSSHALYKKCIILLRSLYSTVRILPAYKFFQDLNSSGQIRMFSLANRVSSFVEPFTRGEEAEMQKFEFTPVDTTCGRLCLSVLYHPTLDVSSELLTPLSQQVIPDYVGSPTTNPLKRFPSLPVSGLVSIGSPSRAPFPRVRSCGYELYRASVPSVPSPSSPIKLDSNAFFSNQSFDPLQPGSVPNYPSLNSHYRNASLVHKNTSFDEYWPSPMFSPSLSPSPPTRFPCNNRFKALLRSESAPERESIPRAKLGRSPVFPNCHIPPLSPSPRGTKAGCSSQSQAERALMRLVDAQFCATTQKTNSFGKDEIENLLGAKLSSNSSPRVSFSRSSGFTDDDSDFPCPFAVDDDDDITDPRFRPESFDGKGHQGEPLKPGGLLTMRRSQDAAIGDLVRMLKAASPLQQDFSNSIKLSQVSKTDVLSKSIKKSDENSNSDAGAAQNTASVSGLTSCGLHMLKTTAEALDELQSYREIKELLLRQCDGKFGGLGSQTLENDSNEEETIGRDTI